jgi:hypothetical protein
MAGKLLLALQSVVTLASSNTVLHSSRSCYLPLQFPTPMLFRSSSTDPSRLTLGFPTLRVPSGLSRVNFLQGSSSCILNWPTYCTAYFNFYIFRKQTEITVTAKTDKLQKLRRDNIYSRRGVQMYEIYVASLFRLQHFY